MLVLSRKTNESIIIGDHIEIKVLAIEGEQVKLGIVAPKSVKVHRSEVFEAIQEQNKAALNIDTNIIQKLTKKK
ncbi:carbon storage regulator CsrA [Ureibacillus thermosphaericus]|uniref:Translational regulator CsrA n=1 Tax=Ureibacillus thermosphaericus TaxID=51173 RepID=A0A840PUW3_URETH|nr:carbon storage regulator CsrA [Ureibacillus thermosphaericus]MBB5149723.1 carbon storage regulator [Ureibacillus thermosphaericus]NKZ32643.1 carbon storage regulator CsrA [Ureibacillus thermosphaericus]